MNKVSFNGQYRVDFLTDKVLEYLDIQDQSKPFFLFISYLEPHHQNKYLIGGHFEGPKGSKEKFKNYELPGDLKDAKGNWSKEYPDYLGCCKSVDDNLDRINQKLNDLGLSENTIIIYTSDHGCHFKTRNMEYKRSCHESSVHVPLVIKGPGFLGGKVVSNLISQIDYGPTVLTMAGIKIPEHMEGRPMQDLLDGKSHNWPEEVFIQISEAQIGRAIRTKKWKYSVRGPQKTGFFKSFSNTYTEEYLYDLENDINEQINLVSKPSLSDVREELRAKLIDYIKRVENNEPKIFSKLD